MKKRGNFLLEKAEEIIVLRLVLRVVFGNNLGTGPDDRLAVGKEPCPYFRSLSM